MSLLGIDIGTTNCKAGLFREDGTVIHIAGRPTITGSERDGTTFYNPQVLWHTVAACIREAAEANENSGKSSGGLGGEPITAIGIASMAESGLLVDAVTGEPRTSFIPWFDRRSSKEADELAREDDVFARFQASGLRSSFKYGLAKLLWLRRNQTSVLHNSVWLSAADYIAYLLTGVMATDYSLAGRTFAFDIRDKRWDEDWIRHFGMSPALFPQALPAGTAIGHTKGSRASQAGLRVGVPVTVAGHDHVAASIAVGAVKEGDAYDSIGTAETLVGLLQDRPLTKEDFASGLSYGIHAVPGFSYWMGGISASGGSVEWMRGILGEKNPISYEDVMGLVDKAPKGPTGIVYLPYLSGSGAPLPDANARGAFIGLTAAHGRSHLMKAVLEGAAFEMEAIRRAAMQASGAGGGRVVAVGGGTRNEVWMRIKADISGCRIDVPMLEEATLLGAAVTAAIGTGIYRDAADAVRSAANGRSAREYRPDKKRHEAYCRIFEQGYLPLQQPLREVYTQLTKELEHNE